MDLYSLNFLLGSVFTLLAGLFVFYKGEAREGIRRTWLCLCLSTSVWHAGRFFIAIAGSPDLAEFAVYVIYFGAIFIPSFFLHFVLTLLNEAGKRRKALVACYGLALAELILLGTGQLVTGVRRDSILGFYEIPTRVYVIHFIVFTTVPTYALWRLIRSYLESDLPTRANQLKYVIFASLIGFLGGGTSFLPIIEAPIPPFGAPLTYFYTFPIAYAIARYRLMDINVVLRRSVIYALVLFSLLIPCYLIVIWGQKAAFGSINYVFSLVTLLLFIASGFLFPKFRFRTEEALERVLFKKRTDYRETLLRSSQDMVSIVNLNELSDRLVRTVGRALGIEKVSLFLLDEAKGCFAPQASSGLDMDQLKERTIPRDDFLIQRLIARPEAVVREEIEMARDGPKRQAAVERMKALQAEITVPILSKEKLIGMLNLGHKEGREMYSNEDLELLSTLANQAAIAIENARLYENLKQSQNIIRRADRLSSLGLLTAGLAHEIRNPLVAIRTFTQLLPERYQDAEFRDSFQGLALKEVDRICGLINDLLSFARPSRPNVSEENVNEIIDGIGRILESEAKEKGVEMQRQFAPDLPKIWIDREQMKQVFMNVVLNAIQSMENGGMVEISTRLFAKNGTEQAAQFVQIEIRDNGVGIADEDLEHIFDPFFTNKKEGSGLGLSISHQIVQEHGGYFVVESKVERGTSFFINLPVGRLERPKADEYQSLHEKNLSR